MAFARYKLSNKFLKCLERMLHMLHVLARDNVPSSFYDLHICIHLIIGV